MVSRSLFSYVLLFGHHKRLERLLYVHALYLTLVDLGFGYIITFCT